MIRLAAEQDAQALYLLNEAFNGSGLTTPEHIRHMSKSCDRHPETE